MNGWTIFLDGSNGSTPNGTLDQGELSTVTGPGGAYCFTDLGPGTYIVREVQKPNWQQYSSNPDPITGISGQDVSNVDFGNAMINPGVGRTKGFWHNQNGHAVIELLGGWNDPGEGPLTAVQLALKDLCLRNSDGSLFFAGNYAQDLFDGFLTNDTDASNMANMLSAQAAASLLNSMAGNAGLTVEGQTFASSDTLLSVSTTISANGYITVGELLARAKEVLCTGGSANLVIDSYHPLHAYAEALKSALDAFNNNTNIVNA
jgi:hypothetical protein